MSEGHPVNPYPIRPGDDGDDGDVTTGGSAFPAHTWSATTTKHRGDVSVDQFNLLGVRARRPGASNDERRQSEMDSTLERAALHHAVDTEQTERHLLSAAFYDETYKAFWTALTRHDLTVADFSGPFHREVASALLGHARLGVAPTVQSVRFVTEQIGADWSIGDGWRLDIILDATCHAQLIDRYAEMLAETVERRRRARGLLRDAEWLLAGDRLTRPAGVRAATVDECDEKPRVHVPSGVRRSLRRRSRHG